jgi:tetratricopeptide (TPR) repeat protein
MAKRVRSALFIALMLATLTAARPAQTQPATHLGKVDFATSCSADAQATFETAVALMHSFQYMEAKQAFDEAATRDPKCAIAHWGKAIVLYEQIWDLPDQKKLAEGHQEAELAKKLHARTAREKGFIASAVAYYQKSTKISHTDRTKAYSAALSKLHAQMPDDVEVGSFYALSLVSLSYAEVDGLENQKKAVAILQPLLQKYPDHPGVAHYLIHATDRPELAPEGLEAARRYAAIAPDSPHALHMPSHIFVRLGLWQDSITSNIAAEASARKLAEEHKAESHYQTHAMDFLNYSYLQTGQEAKAREVVAHMDHVVGADEENKEQHRAYLAARTAVELHRWKEAETLRIPAIRKDQQDVTFWARAIGAAQVRDVAASEAAVNGLRESVTERENRARNDGYNVSKEKATDLSEAEAWLLFAKGQVDEAVKEMRQAAEHQEKNGGESVGVPAREMLADMLAEIKRPEEALVEYRMVLKNAPNRFDTLLGAARASQASGAKSGAQLMYSRLAEMCPAGDRPELAEAKTFVAKN